MAIKVTNSKEAFCAAVDGNDVYIIARAGDDFQWLKHKDADFLVKYPDYDETDTKKTEEAPAAEPKKEDPEEVVSDGNKGKILALTRRGWNVKAIAGEVKCSPQTVRNWQKKFREEGMLDMTM